MDPLTILIWLLVLAFAVWLIDWLITRFVPAAVPHKGVIVIIAVFIFLVWLLQQIR